MNYPLISEYIDAIKSANDNFEELSYLSPVLGDDGLPVMTSGNFAVVFKMKDEQSGKFYAIKCFTKEQEGRAEAYREISKELEGISSPYILSVRYFDKELFVDTNQTMETEFPVLLMDWVEGKTLDKYLRDNLDDKYTLEMLAYRFSQLAQWLIPQPFAHGDLKPDNILVREDGTLVLIDYDGMYVPAMKGQKARELGSPDFRHPLRNENDFDENIDDFPILSILVSLIGISKFPDYLAKYGASDRLLFSKADYASIAQQRIIKDLFLIDDGNLRTLTSAFVCLCYHSFPITIPSLDKPVKIGDIEGKLIPGVEILSKSTDSAPNHSLSIGEMLEGLMQLNELVIANGIDYVLTGSLGLYMHGLIPVSYIPHDIDIVFSDKNDNTNLANEMILDLFMRYSSEKRQEYYDSDLFVFYIGKNKIEINAFADINNIIAKQDFRVMKILGNEIKVANTFSILEKKYQMQRLKDYQFNNMLQTTFNSLFIPKQADLEKEKVREFFIGLKLIGIDIFIVLFNDDLKRIWLPEQLWEKCIFCISPWYESLGCPNVKFGIKGEFTRISKLDWNKAFYEILDHDFSYIVNFLYNILCTMKVHIKSV